MSGGSCDMIDLSVLFYTKCSIPNESMNLIPIESNLTQTNLTYTWWLSLGIASQIQLVIV